MVVTPFGEGCQIDIWQRTVAMVGYTEISVRGNRVTFVMSNGVAHSGKTTIEIRPRRMVSPVAQSPYGERWLGFRLGRGGPPYGLQ
jgi:hypothetical protein